METCNVNVTGWSDIHGHRVDLCSCPVIRLAVHVNLFYD